MNLTDLYDAILNGKLDRAVAVTNEAISEGVLPNEIITNYMIKAMEEIGNRFEAGKVFVPNLLMSARAMKGALDILKPLLQGETDAYVGKIVIGTVKGDGIIQDCSLVKKKLVGKKYHLTKIDHETHNYIGTVEGKKGEFSFFPEVLEYSL